MQPLIDSAPTWVTPFLMTSIKATFVLALAGGLATIMRRAPAAVRHGIWTAGIVGAIAVPFVPRMLPTIEIQAPPSVVAVRRPGARHVTYRDPPRHPSSRPHRSKPRVP